MNYLTQLDIDDSTVICLSILQSVCMGYYEKNSAVGQCWDKAWQLFVHIPKNYQQLISTYVPSESESLLVTREILLGTGSCIPQGQTINLKETLTVETNVL